MGILLHKLPILPPAFQAGINPFYPRIGNVMCTYTYIHRWNTFTDGTVID